jgi:ABC-type xylose transport system permease subunit
MRWQDSPAALLYFDRAGVETHWFGCPWRSKGNNKGDSIIIIVVVMIIVIIIICMRTTRVAAGRHILAMHCERADTMLLSYCERAVTMLLNRRYTV